jgi:hypothetical protein
MGIKKFMYVGVTFYKIDINKISKESNLLSY